MQAAAGVRRAARRVLDIRWPLRGVGCAGALALVLGAWLYARHVGVGPGDWIAAAVAAVAGWFCALICVAMAWECARIVRHRPPLELAGTSPPSWRREWVAPLVISAGVVIGWLFFK